MYLLMATAGIGGGVLWLLVLTVIRRWRRQAPNTLFEMLAAGTCIAYLVLPLTHHIIGTDGYYYISDAANFFGLTWYYQVFAWLLTAVFAWGITRWRLHWQ